MSSFDPDPEVNPYAPPSAPLDGPTAEIPDELAKAEAIRKKYLNHEASVKSVGTLHILGACFNAVTALAALVSMFKGVRVSLTSAVVVGVIGFGLNGGITALNVTVGVGLRRLRTWARWVEVAILFLGIVFVIGATILDLSTSGGQSSSAILILLIWVAISTYVLNLLLSDKGKMVFSPAYREVIDQTPDIKYKMGCLMRGFLYLIVVLMGLRAVGWLLTNIKL